ncbi:copper resistance protein NlpE [Methylomonas albis]|uniref:Copper resistance protein NlpE N-terminal domain-containing protein n=1 Tax=Methylomonas albis TaxID=1854563 RepID=A0ABR9D3L9_9GAMM|nr:copper resistance protein NlpE [Methylomonas albis]MBD9357706.1 copper resistance protein NlpE N-terminal domain-containing protein [Methylomonas albis]
MRTVNLKLKKNLVFFLVIAAFSAYNPALAEPAAADDKDTHHEHKSLDWPGIYNGLTPCADCIGVKTSLALNKNGSYLLMTQFLGKSEREFTEKGKFAPGDKANTLVLTPKNGSASQQYLVEKDVLIQLDSNGNRISGKLADRYILRRTSVTDKQPEHSGH